MLCHQKKIDFVSCFENEFTFTHHSFLSKLYSLNAKSEEIERENNFIEFIRAETSLMILFAPFIQIFDYQFRFLR